MTNSVEINLLYSSWFVSMCWAACDCVIFLFQEKIGKVSILQRKRGTAGTKSEKDAFKTIGVANIPLHEIGTWPCWRVNSYCVLYCCLFRTHKLSHCKSLWSLLIVLCLCCVSSCEWGRGYCTGRRTWHANSFVMVCKWECIC